MKRTAWVVLGLAFFIGSTQAEQTSAEHHQAMRQRAQQLLPYSVEQAFESFSKTASGGIMHIAAKSAGDPKQIEHIQGYLIKTAKEYGNGDFSSTESFHGSDMPGLARMKAAKSAIRYEYKALPDGGEILFSADEGEALNALHEWLDAQMKEHGHTDRVE